MSIRNFSKLLQKMTLRETVQMPKCVPFRDFSSRNATDSAAKKMEKEMKDMDSEFKGQLEKNDKQSEADNSARGREAYLKKGEEAEKQQLEKVQKSEKRDTESSKKTENVEFEKDTQDKGQKYGEKKSSKSEDSSNKKQDTEKLSKQANVEA